MCQELCQALSRGYLISSSPQLYDRVAERQLRLRDKAH